MNMMVDESLQLYSQRRRLNVKSLNKACFPRSSCGRWWRRRPTSGRGQRTCAWSPGRRSPWWPPRRPPPPPVRTNTIYSRFIQVLWHFLFFCTTETEWPFRTQQGKRKALSNKQAYPATVSLSPCRVLHFRNQVNGIPWSRTTQTETTAPLTPSSSSWHRARRRTGPAGRKWRRGSIGQWERILNNFGTIWFLYLVAKCKLQSHS